MTEPDWRMIRSGATFEALALTLVFFEDPKAALFGRRGKDGGQDARSGDGTLVYQAKYHETDSAAKAIADAKAEAAKIREYRAPAHKREPEWRLVTAWRLVTNAEFNPTDEKRWIDEVVPRFAEIGLKADHWLRPNLNGLLAKHPEVARAFFQNQTRVFLSIPEARERIASMEPFLRRPAPQAYQGQRAALDRVRGFLTSGRSYLVVSGPGGVGKTRFLLEAGMEAANDSWQVLWANVASMPEGRWFDAIVPERPTLLLVDEPDDDRLLGQLMEHVGAAIGRCSAWKAAIAVRSPKDPVLRFLRAPKVQPQCEYLELECPLEEDAANLCLGLFEGGPLDARPAPEKKALALELARRFDRNPIWISLAVRILESNQDLVQVPKEAHGLAEFYLREVYTQQDDYPPQTLKAVVRWVSLLGTLNREDDSVRDIVRRKTGILDDSVFLPCLASLVKRRVLFQRGARDRLVEMKPDVLRDHVLRDWLVTDAAFGTAPLQASEAAKSLAADVVDAIRKRGVGAVAKSIIHSLARTEFILRAGGSPARVLDPLFTELRSILDDLGATRRALLPDLLCVVAQVRPMDVVAMCRTLRESTCAREPSTGLFGSRLVGQDDVVLELAWAVYHAAMGAQMKSERLAIVEELCSLIEAETAIGRERGGGLPNDGKRAVALLKRSIEGGPQFWDDCEAEAVEAASLRLHGLAECNSLEPESQAVLEALLEPLTAVQREQTWSEGFTVHIQTYCVLPGHPKWESRKALLDAIGSILTGEKAIQDVRIALWGIVSTAHHSVNRASDRKKPLAEDPFAREMMETLDWAFGALSKRSLSIREFRAARRLWEWHLEYDDDPSRRQLAERLESLYLATDLAREFAPLVKFLPPGEGDRVAREKADALVARKSAPEIDRFVDRAVEFLGDEGRLPEVLQIAQFLGEKAPSEGPVQAFIKSALTDAEITPRFHFAVVALAAWVCKLRASTDPKQGVSLVRSLVNLPGSSKARIALLRGLYGGSVPPRDCMSFPPEEHEYLRSLADDLIREGQGVTFLRMIGWSIDHDWDGYKKLIEGALGRVPESEGGTGVATLAEAIYWGVRRIVERHLALPDDLGVWILHRLVRVADLNHVGGMFEWHVEEILKVAGRPTVETFVEALLARREFLRLAGVEEKGLLLPYSWRLSKLVAPLQEEQTGDEGVSRSMKRFLQLAIDDEWYSYSLAEYVRDADPKGLTVPELIREAYGALSEKDERIALRLAHIGGTYQMNSPSWRTIAKAAVTVAARFGERKRGQLLYELAGRHSQSWSSAPGEVPALFIQQVERARECLAKETDPELIPFWKWNLSAVEESLRIQEEEAKEDREE